MKNGWESKRLGDVCEFVKEQGEWTDLPYVGLEHIESNTGIFLGSRLPHTVKSTTFRFNTENVLYGRLRPYLNKVLLPDFDGHCSTEIFPIKPTEQLDRHYLSYWLRSDETVAKINATSTGARMPRANMNQVLEFKISVPPIEEQRRIVAILDEAFACIDKAKANTKKNIQNARELFDSYLNNIFSNPGPDWEADSFVNLCNLITCGVAATPTYVDKTVGVPFLSAQNVRNGEVVLDKYKFISNEFHRELTKKNKPQKGDVLYSRVGAKFGEAGVVEHDFDFSVYVSLTLIKPRPERLNNYFLKYLLNSPSIKELAKKSIGSSGVPNLNVKDVREFFIHYPSISMQKKIVEMIETIQVETQSLEVIYKKKMDDLEEAQKTILKSAFSGEIR